VSLYKLGVSPSFFKELLEYEECQYFLDEIAKHKLRTDVDKSKTLIADVVAAICATSGKKASKVYYSRIHSLNGIALRIDEGDIEQEKVKTLFDIAKEDAEVKVVNKKKRKYFEIVNEAVNRRS